MSDGNPTVGIPLSNEALAAAILAAAAKVDREQERLAEAEARLHDARQEHSLLLDLARLRGVAAPGLSDRRRVDEADDVLPSTTGPVGDGRQALVRVVLDILRAHGEPMPIRALMAEVVSQGPPIPGRGEQANLISVITRVPEISRPSRGVYGLREWDPAAPAASEPAKTGKRKRKIAR